MIHTDNQASLATSAPSAAELKHKVSELIAKLNQVILDKPSVVKLSLVCLLANGHLLLQDLPGMGKTTLAHALANLLGLSFNRIQFTNDMLPADILGMNIYNQSNHEFEFRKGAIFTQLLLADEINRSSPKTQSALLEAMEERQVTQDSISYPLPSPFFVIATQNPAQQSGVYPLPESQLDRFLMCLSLGYPSPSAERQLLTGVDRRDLIDTSTPLFSTQEVLAIQQHVQNIFMADVVIDYLQRLVAKTRESQDFHGLSPRGVLALKRAAQAHAYVTGYDEVTPEDIQAVFAAVVDHRVGQHFVPFTHLGGIQQTTIAQRIMQQVSVVV